MEKTKHNYSCDRCTRQQESATYIPAASISAAVPHDNIGGGEKVIQLSTIKLQSDGVET